MNPCQDVNADLTPVERAEQLRQAALVKDPDSYIDCLERLANRGMEFSSWPGYKEIERHIREAECLAVDRVARIAEGIIARSSLPPQERDRLQNELRNRIIEEGTI